jgi:hypothetical protein
LPRSPEPRRQRRQLASRLAGVGLGILLAGCAGEDAGQVASEEAGARAAGSLSGIAARSLPIIGGQVDVRCAGGPDLRTFTRADGSWQVTMSGQTMPCKLRVSGGSLGADEVYHALAIDLDSASITPLTDLVVASLAGRAPAAWWQNTTAAELRSLTPAQVGAAIERIRRGLAPGTLPGLDAIGAALAGAPADRVAQALASLRTAAPDLGELLAMVQGPAFPTEVRAYAAALAQALAGPDSGAGTGTATPPAIPDPVPATPVMSTLTIRVTAAGMSLQPLVVGSVPRPASQEAFCSEIASAASGISLSAAIPSTLGSVTLRSCSLAGNVGTVGATLSLQSPFPFTTQGVATYTYE